MFNISGGEGAKKSEEKQIFGRKNQKKETKTKSHLLFNLIRRNKIKERKMK